MVSHFSVLGLTFHLYGLVIGVAIVVAAVLAARILKKGGVKEDEFWAVALWAVVGGVLGARLWHVMTDWHVYQDDLIAALYIWRGGLSIIGALVGGFIGAWLGVRQSPSKFELQLWQLTDAVAVTAPFGQAIGRLGNWINQELYGSPTNLPWRLYIDRENRLEGFEETEYYHPLFAYEMIALCLLGLALWLLLARGRFFRLGSGMTTLAYIAGYGYIRFFLEFLRLEKSYFFGMSLGFNQVIVGVCAIGATIALVQKVRGNKHA